MLDNVGLWSNNHGLNQHCARGRGGVTISSDHGRLYLTKNKMASQNSKTRCVLKRPTDIISMIVGKIITRMRTFSRLKVKAKETRCFQNLTKR
jgi:hypothetical protein